ncbi:hypothetical protein RHGRI_013300 [Rhododendron griersonianum]|uniref:Uncharacterized protein n=1 Tax=Rhododendron griersonianum TaxID=479676 RepID=A0AAV6K5C8_9ERIC|nr:hypothetical protein RHGRI_013300 [Rhododendron griersonianum]
MLQGMQTVLQKLQGLESTSQQCNSNTQSIARLESQIGQLANAFSEREEGKLPSQPVSNPRGQFQVDHQQAPNHYEEQAKAVIALRSGRVIETRPTEDTPKEQDAHSSSSRQKGKDKVLKEKGATPLDTHTTSPTSHSTNSAMVPPGMPRTKADSRLSAFSLVSKLVHRKSVASEDEETKSGVFENFDAALHSLNNHKMSKSENAVDFKNMQHQLGNMESSIQDIEEGLEFLFRRLIKTRVILLNILNH